MKVRQLRKRKPRGRALPAIRWVNVLTDVPVCAPLPLHELLAEQLFLTLQRNACVPYTPDGWPMLRQAVDEWVECNGPPPGYEVRP